MYTTVGLGLHLKKNIFRLVKWLYVLHILLIIYELYITIALKFRSSALTRPPAETTEIPPDEKV